MYENWWLEVVFRAELSAELGVDWTEEVVVQRSSGSDHDFRHGIASSNGFRFRFYVLECCVQQRNAAQAWANSGFHG